MLSRFYIVRTVEGERPVNLRIPLDLEDMAKLETLLEAVVFNPDKRDIFVFALELSDKIKYMLSDKAIERAQETIYGPVWVAPWAPMLLKLRTWFRWKIAHFLNRYLDVCWAELVPWAMIDTFDRPFLDILEIRGSAGQCFRHGETAYCGKCEITNYGR